MEEFAKTELVEAAAAGTGVNDNRESDMEKTERNRHEAEKVFAVGKKELVFGLEILLSSLLAANMTMFGGFNLGFTIASAACILCSAGYLWWSGMRPTGYSAALLGLSLVIAGSFVRSDDGFVKFVMVCFLLVSVSLGLCLQAGKNRRRPENAASLMDAGYALFSLGLGEMGAAGRGLKHAFRETGSVGKKSSAVLLGLGIAFPVLLIIVPLLMRADAAFEAVLDQLPPISFGEIFCTVLFGGGIACVLYTRGTALKYGGQSKAEPRERKGLAPLTVNTVLASVGLVYGVYLISQLAYFTGGFAGVLPDGYTLAQYARRGFFEMAILCGINLSIIIFGLWVCRKKERAPMSTRIFCLFIGIVTLFMVVAASAKMVLYIENYGLTRLRVLTQVIMIFLGMVNLVVCIWLFVPRLPYMKAIMLTALIIGAVVSWTDVDTVVAEYNVSAYLSGEMESVDVIYLNRLGDGAVSALARLAEEAADPRVASLAQIVLKNREPDRIEDFRGWNYVDSAAAGYLGGE